MILTILACYLLVGVLCGVLLLLIFGVPKQATKQIPTILGFWAAMWLPMIGVGVYSLVRKRK